MRNLASTVFALSLLCGVTPRTTSAAQPNLRDYTSGKPRLEVRALPRFGFATPTRSFNWTVTAEIKGPEVESYYCPGVLWKYTSAMGETKNYQEGDCPPFEQRQSRQVCAQNASLEQEVGDESPDEAKSKVDECIGNSTYNNNSYQRVWTRSFHTGVYGNQSVCVTLIKNKKIIANKCVTVQVSGGD